MVPRHHPECYLTHAHDADLPQSVNPRLFVLRPQTIPPDKMVNSVELTADAYLVCLTHALSTEKEEVMGLLLGEVSKDLGTKLTMVLLM